MNKVVRVDIPDINEREYQALRHIACKTYGKNSISYFVTQLIRAILQENEQLAIKITPPIVEVDRLELRLSKKEKTQLYQLAQSHHMTTNAFISSLVRNYLNKTPLLTAAEVDALYQSNAQLLRIGRNLNQIAKQFHSMEGGNITSEQITALQNIINTHTEKVGELLLSNRRRNNE
ncbi:plasmid mobilization protein [Neisseria sp. Ec49-e6-T10]|uniref:plasmid mobilization protein n=1 Tax=Neisseria sp. Ec49-e6-T10 TaxID=3140744 RepID=UPI003EBD4443